MEKEKIIEEMAKDIPFLTLDREVFVGATEKRKVGWTLSEEDNKVIAEELYNAGYRKIPEGSVVLSKEEYEKMKSLYDCGNGYMTSQIGDLPLTVESLRKAVDEITRLNRVEAELQELNAKYYNEAKDLRRKVNRLEAHAKINDAHLHIRWTEQARKETAKEFAEKFISELIQRRLITKKEDLYFEMLELKDELFKQYGVEE